MYLEPQPARLCLHACIVPRVATAPDLGSWRRRDWVAAHLNEVQHIVEDAGDVLVVCICTVGTASGCYNGTCITQW